MRVFLIFCFVVFAPFAFAQSTPPTGPIKMSTVSVSSGGGGGGANCELAGDVDCEMIGAVRLAVDPLFATLAFVTDTDTGIGWGGFSGATAFYGDGFPLMLLQTDGSLSLSDSTGKSIFSCFGAADTCDFFADVAGVLSVNGEVLASGGSLTNPSFSFAGDTNTGVARLLPDTLSLITNGVDRLSITTGDIVPTVPVRGQAGSATAPTFSWQSDSNTGFYNSAADQISATVNGSEIVRFNATGISDQATTGSLNLQRGAGSATVPTYSFAGDTNMGLYRSAADTLMVTLNGANELSVSTAAIGPAVAGGLSLATTALPFSSVNLQAGTASVLSLTMGDTNTGLFGGADQINLATNGTARVQLNNTTIQPSATNDSYDIGTSSIGFKIAYLGSGIIGTGAAKALVISDVDGVQNTSSGGPITLSSGGNDLAISTAGLVTMPLTSSTTYTQALRLPGFLGATGAASAPSCSTSADAAKMFYVDRSGDGVAADICVCAANAADSYSLVRVTDLTTACDALP